MALLSAKEIFDKDDAEFLDVPVPEWGGEVRIKALTGTKRDKYENSLAKMKNGQMVPDVMNARARLVAWSAINADGSALFGDSEIMRLGNKNAKALDRVFEAAAKLSGIAPEDVETAREDFSEGQSEDSTSG